MDHAQHTQQANKHGQHAEIINGDGFLIGVFTLISIALLALTMWFTTNGHEFFSASSAEAQTPTTSLSAP